MIKKLELLNKICNQALDNKPVVIKDKSVIIKSILFCDDMESYSIRILSDNKLFDIITGLNKDQITRLQSFLTLKPRVRLNTSNLKMYGGETSIEKVVTVLTDIIDADDKTTVTIKKQKNAFSIFTIHNLYNKNGKYAKQILAQKQTPIMQYEYILRSTYQGRFNDILDYSCLSLELNGYQEGLISDSCVYTPNTHNKSQYLCKVIDERKSAKGSDSVNVKASIASFSLERHGIKISYKGSFETACSVKIAGISSFVKCVSDNHMKYIKSFNNGLIVLRDAMPEDVLDVFYNYNQPTDSDIIVGFWFGVNPLIQDNPKINISSIRLRDGMATLNESVIKENYEQLLILSSDLNFIIVPEDSPLTINQILNLAERTKVYWLSQFKDLSYICDLVPMHLLNNFSQSFLYAGSCRGDEGITSHATIQQMIVKQDYNMLRSISLSRYFLMRDISKLQSNIITSNNDSEVDTDVLSPFYHNKLDTFEISKQKLRQQETKKEIIKDAPLVKIEYIDLFSFLLEDSSAKALIISDNISLINSNNIKESIYYPDSMSFGVMLRLFLEIEPNKDIYSTLLKYGGVIFTTNLPTKNGTEIYRVKIAQVSSNTVIGTGYQIKVESINNSMTKIIDMPLRPGLTILGGDDTHTLLKGVIPQIMNKEVALIDMPHDVTIGEFDNSVSSLITYHGKMSYRIEELMYLQPQVLIINTIEYYKLKDIMEFIDSFCDLRLQSVIITTRDSYRLLTQMNSSMNYFNLKDVNLIANQLRIPSIKDKDTFIYIREYITQETLSRSGITNQPIESLKLNMQSQDGSIYNTLQQYVIRGEVDEKELTRYQVVNEIGNTFTRSNRVI